MAVLSLMNDLKTTLNANGNNLEDLKSVAFTLDSLYKTNSMSAPKDLSPKEIYDELCLLPNDPDYTPQTRLVKQHELKQKLLSIISSIIESTKSNNTTHADPPKKFLTMVRENSLEVIIQLFKFIVLRIKGRGDKGILRVFYIALFAISLIGFFYWLSTKNKKPDQSVNYIMTADTLINDYTKKKLFYEKRRDLLKDKIKEESKGNIEHKRALLLELRAVESKLDTLDGGILPNLARIKKNEIDSAGRSSINSYKQKFQNF